MNCPHGARPEAHCFERACQQNVFDVRERGHGVVRVVNVLCDTCGHGVGRRRPDGYGGGLSARTLRDFFAQHRGHQTHWKMIEVDTRRELLGGGVPPVRVDSDRPEDALQ